MCVCAGVCINIYTSESVKEGRLVSVRATIQEETNKNSVYVRKMALGDKVLSEHLRQQKPDGEQQLETSR